jgi:hypothetical protein
VAADLPVEVAATLGITSPAPSESAVRRLVQRLDPEQLDTAIGAWIQQLSNAVAPDRRRRVLAVDGKTLRGSRTAEGARHSITVDQNGRSIMPGELSRLIRRQPGGSLWS